MSTDSPGRRTIARLATAVIAALVVIAAAPGAASAASMTAASSGRVTAAAASSMALLAGGDAMVHDASAAKKKKKPAAASCPAGTTPIVTKRRGKPALKRNRRGRLRCRAVKRSNLRAPAKTPTLQIGQVADMLDSVADIKPKAFRRLERAIGRRRADRLLKLGLNAWRKTAGAAAGHAGRAHQSATETTFSQGGADGKATFGLEAIEGDQSGFRAKASAEMKVTRADIEKFSTDLKDKLPADVTGAGAKVDVSFEDVAATCPDDKGAVPGKLRGKGSITVTVERSGGPPIEVRLSADVDTTYTAQVGADGKVSAVNGVGVQTTFQTGGSGNSTETYRGRVLGTGFGRSGILDAPAGKAGAAIERDSAQIDPNSGGVFGPRGSWRYGRGFPISDLRTLDNVKAMAATSIATNVLTLAALEYLRKVTLDRIEKSPCGYYVFVEINSRTVTASYQAFGALKFTVAARAVPGSKTRWTGTAPAQFTDLSFTAKSECLMHTPVNTAGTFTVDLELLPSGNLKVTWSADPSSSASIDCPPDDSEPPYDPPPIPGMTGPSLLGVTPTTFELPATGGLQVIGGGIDAGDGDGFFDSGSLLVSRNK
jgi:hypothetical protein